MAGRLHLGRIFLSIGQFESETMLHTWQQNLEVQVLVGHADNTVTDTAQIHHI